MDPTRDLVLKILPLWGFKPYVPYEPYENEPYIEVVTSVPESFRTYLTNYQDVAEAIPPNTKQITISNWGEALSLTGIWSKLTRLHLLGNMNLNAVIGDNWADIIHNVASGEESIITHLSLPETVLEVPANLCQENTQLKEFSAPGAVKFGNYCLDGCTALQWADGTSAEELGDYSLRGLTQLQQFEGTGLRVIGQYALSNTIKEDTKVWLANIEELNSGSLENAALSDKHTTSDSNQEKRWVADSINKVALQFKKLWQFAYQSLSEASTKYAYEMESIIGINATNWATVNKTPIWTPNLQIAECSYDVRGIPYCTRLPAIMDSRTIIYDSQTGEKLTTTQTGEVEVDVTNWPAGGNQLTLNNDVLLKGVISTDFGKYMKQGNAQKITYDITMEPTSKLGLPGGAKSARIQILKAPKTLWSGSSGQYTQLYISDEAAENITNIETTVSTTSKLFLTEQGMTIANRDGLNAFGRAWGSITQCDPWW